MSTTRIRLPDGSYVNIATSDPKQASATARKIWANKQPKRTGLDKFVNETVPDFAGDIVDNLVPNWGDEIYAAPRAVAALVKGEDAGKAFRNAQRNFKGYQKSYDKEHPAAAWGSTIAGQGGAILLPASKVMKGASLAQKVKTAAKTGAAFGALAGAGEGEGLDPVRRATNAGAQAAIGAGVGAGIPVGGKVVQKGTRWARGNVPGVDRVAQATESALSRLTPPSLRRPARPAGEQQADRVLAERMQAGNIADGFGQPGPKASPQAIAAEVQKRNEMGVPAMIGDVTEPLREVTEYSSRGMGPGQTLVRQRLDERKATESLRVRQHVKDTFPTTDDPIRFVEESKRAARARGAPAYAEAYAQPMVVTPEIAGITETPAFRDALPQAYNNIRNQIDPETLRPQDPQAMGFRVMDADPNGLPPNIPTFRTPDGRMVAWDKGLSTEGFDQAIRAMGDQGRAASNVNPVTGKLESTTNSVHINSRASDLRRLLGEQNEPYRNAYQRYGDDMAQVSAFENGMDVGKLTGHEINAQRRTTPDAAQDAWTTAAGTAMADEASRYGGKYPTGSTANQVRKMIGDPTKQEAISEMSGNTGGVRQLLDRLEYEQQGNINWQGVNGNSKTASRQALDEDFNVAANVPTTAQGAVTRLLDFIVSGATPKYKQDVKRRLAEVVTASDAKSVEEALAAIEAQALRDRKFGDMMHRAGVTGSALYGMNVLPVDPTPEP